MKDFLNTHGRLSESHPLLDWLRWGALVPIVSSNGYMLSLGVASFWRTHTASEISIAASAGLAVSLTAGWISCLVERRFGSCLLGCLALSLYLSALGWDSLSAPSWGPSAALHLVAIGLVTATHPKGRAGSLLTRWRLFSDRIDAELEKAPGLLPWIPSVLGRLLYQRSNRRNPGRVELKTPVQEVLLRFEQEVQTRRALLAQRVELATGDQQARFETEALQAAAECCSSLEGLDLPSDRQEHLRERAAKILLELEQPGSRAASEVKQGQHEKGSSHQKEERRTVQ